MIKKEEEVWKTYPDYPFIEVSNLGRVRTLDRWVQCNGGKRLVKGRILKQQLNHNGYMQVQFGVNGKYVQLRASCMVAITYIPNPNNLPEVNHIDCDRTNNRVDNLEWCTRQENITYRDKLGHTAKHNALKKPVIAINQETFEIFWFESQSEAARQLGIDGSHIPAVVKGKYRKTYDYWFCDADETAVEKTREKFSDKIVSKVEKLMGEHYN